MIFSSGLLTGRRILVTGASSGIGREAAILLSKCGASLVVTGRHSERLHQTQLALEGHGHRAETFELSGEDNVADFMKMITAGGEPLSGIFHAAGVELIRPVKLSKASSFEEVFSSSVKSALALCRGAAMRDVMRDDSAIIFMSSVAAQRGQTGMSIYASAKAAIDSMARSLAVEFAPRRIRVNSIAAGAIVTEMHERLIKISTVEAIEQYKNKHLLGFGEAIDVARVATFLLSDAGRWVTGATWVVDGGYLAQ